MIERKNLSKGEYILAGINIFLNSSCTIPDFVGAKCWTGHTLEVIL